MHDLHNNCRVKRVISPVAAGTTGTGKTGAVIDRQGFGGVEFICAYGTVTSSTATAVVTVKHGDATGSLTSVADADLLGTEALAGLDAGARTSGVTKNVTKRVGYRGSKRYVQANIYTTATAGTLISCDAVLHSPQLGPTDNP